MPLFSLNIQYFCTKSIRPGYRPHYESTGSHVTIHSEANLKFCSCEGEYLEVSCTSISFSSIVDQNSLQVQILICTLELGHVTKIAAMPIYVKNL